MLKVVFELETTEAVTWSPNDVTSGDDGDEANAERLRYSSNSTRALLLKGEMRYVQSLHLVIFLCKPLSVHCFMLCYFTTCTILCDKFLRARTAAELPAYLKSVRK